MKVHIDNNQLLLTVTLDEFHALNRMSTIYMGIRLDEGMQYQHIDKEYRQLYEDFQREKVILKRLLTSLRRRRLTLTLPTINAPTIFDQRGTGNEYHHNSSPKSIQFKPNDP